MLKLLARRLVGAIAVLAVVSFVTFVLLDVAPGDAAQTLVGEAGSADQVEQVRSELGINVPLLSRYVRFVGSAVFQGDLGRSLITGRKVSTLVQERFKHTLTLVLVAVALALVAGSVVGLTAAARPGGYLDLAVMSATALGLSIPTYWLALLLIMLFSLQLGWLPVAGAGSPAHVVLPATCLALPTAAVVARLMRSSLLDVKGADHVRTANGKGLPPTQVWRDHVVRPGLVPVLTLVGLHLGHMLAGAVIVETVFGWPGLGRLVVQGVLDRDFPVVVGAVLLVAVIYQAINLAVDVAHAWLDPRVGRKAL